jgi:CRISPR type II-A-associated protein Csn2
MKLRIIGFEDEIYLDEENVNIIEIESPKYFANFLGNLNDKINGIENDEIFLLDNDDKELEMNKNMYMIFDLYNIDYNSKKILNKLYEIIENNVEKNQDLELENLMLQIRNYLIQEINELQFEFTMKSELNVSEILKLYNLKIDENNYDTILEKIEFFINIISTLKIASILVIPNLKQYLEKDELLELYKYALYNNIKLILIERKNEEKLKYEKVFFIDTNFCTQII